MTTTESTQKALGSAASLCEEPSLFVYKMNDYVIPHYKMGDGKKKVVWGGEIAAFLHKGWGSGDCYMKVSDC